VVEVVMGLDVVFVIVNTFLSRCALQGWFYDILFTVLLDCEYGEVTLSLCLRLY